MCYNGQHVLIRAAEIRLPKADKRASRAGGGQNTPTDLCEVQVRNTVLGLKGQE